MSFIDELKRQGVTKRSVDTLISRGVDPFTIKSNVEVSCVHGRVKRSDLEVALDPRNEEPCVCPCCENIHARRRDTDSVLCPGCAANAGIIAK